MHPRTLLGLGFILSIAAIAVIVGMKSTVARGDALAALVFEQHDGIHYDCDDNVPIAAAGATFSCRATATDGSTAVYRVVIDRAGRMEATVTDSTPPRSSARL